MTEHEFYAAIKGLAKGNKDMLRAIYDAYGRLIYTIVYDVVKNREDAEDVTSEFFIKLIRVAGTYQKKTSHRAWLIQIARNMAIDLLRKRGHEYLLHETEDAPQDQLEEGGGDGIYRRRTCGIGRGYAAGNADAFRPGAGSAGFEAGGRSQIPGDRKDFRTAAWHGDVAVQSGNQEIKEVSERVWNNRIN